MLSKEVVAVTSGFLAHKLVFIHGEWHLKGPAVVIIHFLLGSLVYVTEISKGFEARQDGVLRATILVICYLSSLFLSISIYRLFFHRLRSFPGPRLAALSKLWHVWKCRDSRGHLVLDSWHKKYGSFVRTGEHGV